MARFDLNHSPLVFFFFHSPLRSDTSSSYPAVDIIDTGIDGASGGIGGAVSIGAGAAAASSVSIHGTPPRKPGIFTIGTASPREDSVR